MAHKKVRVAIIGIGNCASSLVQGVQFYQDTADEAPRSRWITSLVDRSLVHPLISSRRHPGNSRMISAAKKWKRLSREAVMSDVYCLIYRTQYKTCTLKSL